MARRPRRTGSPDARRDPPRVLPACEHLEMREAPDSVLVLVSVTAAGGALIGEALARRAAAGDLGPNVVSGPARSGVPDGLAGPASDRGGQPARTHTDSAAALPVPRHAPAPLDGLGGSGAVVPSAEALRPRAHESPQAGATPVGTG